MTVSRMSTSPPSIGSVPPTGPAKPAEPRLSFSVAALLADTKPHPPSEEVSWPSRIYHTDIRISPYETCVPSPADLRIQDSKNVSPKRSLSKRSSSSEEEEEENDGFVDVEDLKQNLPRSPQPLRPTPYIGAFAPLSSLPAPSLALWAGQQVAAAAAASSFFPSHYPHHAPLNGN